MCECGLIRAVIQAPHRVRAGVSKLTLNTVLPTSYLDPGAGIGELLYSVVAGILAQNMLRVNTFTHLIIADYCAIIKAED